MKDKRPGTFTSGDPRQNRKGRPKKGTALTDILNLKLDEKSESGIMRREIVAEKLITLAEGGDVVALKYIFDRTDGRPKESIDLTDNDVETKLKGILNGT